MDRATSWYCYTYKGENLTHKCNFLTTAALGFFAQMRKPHRLMLATMSQIRPQDHYRGNKCFYKSMTIPKRQLAKIKQSLVV